MGNTPFPSTPVAPISVLEEAQPNDFEEARNDPKFTASHTVLGIRLEYLQELILSLGGTEKFIGMSIMDVEREFFRPMREETKMPLCLDILQRNSAAVGISEIFVTCSWRCQFLELVEALKNEFQQANIYVWLDCFVDFKRPSMTLTSCRALFQEALNVFGRLILIRIPFNPYNHISKEWILEEITNVHEATDVKRVYSFVRDSLRGYIDIEPDSIPKYTIMHRLASLCAEYEEFQDAEAILTQIISSLLCEENLVSKDRHIACLMNERALLYCNVRFYGTSRLREAIREFKKCIHILTSFFGKRHSSVLVVWNNIACIAEKMGKYRPAKRILEYVTRCMYKRLGPGHPDMIVCKNNLACILLHHDEQVTVDIEEIFEDCVANRDVLCEDVKMRQLVYMSNLANVYTTKMKYDEAEPILVDIVKQNRQRLGIGHTETMEVLFSLGRFYDSQGRLDDAVRVFLDCHETLASVSMTNDGTTTHVLLLITAKSYLADVFAKQGRHLKALEMHIDCFERRSEILGSSHEDTLTSMFSLASLYSILGDFEEAESMFTACCEIISSSDKSSALYLNCLHNFGLLREKQTNFEEAEKFKTVLFGADDLDTIASKNSLAGIYESQAKYIEAEEIYIHCLNIRQQLLGKFHPDYLATLNDLAYMYSSTKRYDEAETLFLDCLGNSIDSKHHSTVYMMNLGVMYWTQEKYKEAEPLLEDCYKQRRELFGDDHLLTQLAKDVSNEFSLEKRRHMSRNRTDSFGDGTGTFSLGAATVRMMKAESGVTFSSMNSNHPVTSSPTSPAPPSGMRSSFGSPRKGKHFSEVGEYSNKDDSSMNTTTAM